MPTLAKVLRELKVEDALLYLDQVKMAFGEKPEIYNRFLDIMKNFKAQEIDTPGVIQQVSQLFRGYNKLILGFNTFLPEGYKIELPHVEGAEATMTVITPSGVTVRTVNNSHISTNQKQINNANANLRPDIRVGAPVEFDHAITYVTTIKKRFAHEPDTYKSFLEILHTYQKEQRSIKDVLEQVSELFADHADLLKEFTYFLPDSVQEQAKERLSRAARESEMRRSQQASVEGVLRPNVLTRQDGLRTSTRRSTGTGGRSSRTELDSLAGNRRLTQFAAAIPSSQISSTIDPCNQTSTCSTMSQLKISPWGKTQSNHCSTSPWLSNTGLIQERHLFTRIKQAFTLTTVTYLGWAEFLKCIDLFSQKIIARFEMLLLVTDIFASCAIPPDLLVDLKNLLPKKGGSKYDSDRMATCLEFLEGDDSCKILEANSETRTQSYRAVPLALPCTSHSGHVLNDGWVSRPIGLVEAASFKHVRKNHFEEILFECEDERMEFDMILEAHTSTITALDLLNARIQGTSGRFCNECCTPSNDPGVEAAIESSAFATSHFNAIVRVYGGHSTGVIELACKNPKATLPVILGRLKQKDSKWREGQAYLSQILNQWQLKNSALAIDHRSFYFKQNEKKETSFLVQDSLDISRKSMPISYCFGFQLHWSLVHQMLLELTLDLIEQSSMSQKDKIICKWMCSAFVVPFLGISTSHAETTQYSSHTQTEKPIFSSKLSSDEINAVMKRLKSLDQMSQLHLNRPSCIGTPCIYVFFRLYNHALERFQRAFDVCDFTGVQYDVFLLAVRGVANGSIDSSRYEECCRFLMGAHSHLFLFLDKLLIQLLKQLQKIVNDALSCKLIALWQLQEHFFVRWPDTSREKSTANYNRSLRDYAQCMVSCLDKFDVPTPLYSLAYQNRGGGLRVATEFIVERLL